MATEKLAKEVRGVVKNVSEIEVTNRPLKWSEAEQETLRKLNEAARTMSIPDAWYWGAASGSQQDIFNTKRLEYMVENELQFRVIRCPKCLSSGILVGEQTNSSVCLGCLDENSNTKQSKKGEQKLAEAWAQVRPRDKNFPKRTETGHENEELPLLTDGDKALIAVVHPVVTISSLVLCQFECKILIYRILCHVAFNN